MYCVVTTQTRQTTDREFLLLFGVWSTCATRRGTDVNWKWKISSSSNTFAQIITIIIYYHHQMVELFVFGSFIRLIPYIAYRFPLWNLHFRKTQYFSIRRHFPGHIPSYCQQKHFELSNLWSFFVCPGNLSYVYGHLLNESGLNRGTLSWSYSKT